MKAKMTAKMTATAKATEKNPPLNATGNLRKRAEKRISRLPDSVEEMSIEQMTSEEIRSLIQELRVHHVELEMQKEELLCSQTEASESRRRYEELFNFAPVGYFTLDKKGHIQEANVTGASLLGFAKRSLMGENFHRFVVPEYLNVFHAHLLQAGQGCGKESCQLKIAVKDGPPFDALIETMAAKDDDGAFCYYRSCLTDITQLTRQEELAYLSSFPMLSQNPIVEADMAGAIQFMNPAAERLFPDLRILERQHPWFMDWEAIKTIFLADKTDEMTREIRIGDRWFGQAFYFIEDTGKIRIYGREITQRKKAHDALEESEERYRFLVESSPDGVIVFREERILYANEVALGIFGAGTLEEMQTRNIVDFVHPGDRAAMDVWMRQGREGRRLPLWETRIVGADERVVPVEAVGSLINLQGAAAVQVIIRDISERKATERELQQRTSQLESANKELESFSYSVSHDLRAPLRAIDGFSRMILKKVGDNFDDDTKSKFEVIRNSTRVMGQLIDDLLAFSRMGKQQINLSKLDMNQLFTDAWEELKIANSDRNMTLVIDGMPPVLGDRNLMKQVVINMLSNAVKFTKYLDDARIEAGAFDAGNEMVFYLKDNGAGFDMQYHDKIFGAFQRLHKAEDYEGTGVGLAIVQRIIHRHGCRIWAESEINRGACFYFTMQKLPDM